MILRWNGIRVTILIRNKLRRIRIRPCNDTNTLKSLLHSQFLPKYKILYQICFVFHILFILVYIKQEKRNAQTKIFKINWILTLGPEVQVWTPKREFRMKFSQKSWKKKRFQNCDWNKISLKIIVENFQMIVTVAS